MLNTVLSDSPAQASICAVIITYHPDADFPSRVRRIAGQVARVLIVDNHSDSAALAMIQSLCENTELQESENIPLAVSIEMIANADNRGIAAALNQGAQWAIESGFEWMLTFDQDTLVSETLTASLIAIYSDFSASLPGRSLAMAAANYRGTSNGNSGYVSALPDAAPDKAWMPAEYVITSGCLLSLDVYAALGPFREDFFIDYVDIEYCFRARAQGYCLIVTRECLMDHTVGALTAHHFLRLWWVSNYAAWRWYYRAHNLTLVSRMFFRQEPRWVREAWLNLMVTCAKILLFEPDKVSKAKNIGRGLWNGLRDNP